VPSPEGSTQRTTFTGSTGNPLADAMIVTAESLMVPASERPTVAGVTAGKWGGPVGSGTSLTFSFIGPSSPFAASYPAGYTSDIRSVPDDVKTAFREALQVWSNYTNVTFQEIAETSVNVGDIRIGVTGSNPNFGPGVAGAEAVPPVYSRGFFCRGFVAHSSSGQ